MLQRFPTVPGMVWPLAHAVSSNSRRRPLKLDQARRNILNHHPFCLRILIRDQVEELGERHARAFVGSVLLDPLFIPAVNERVRSNDRGAREGTPSQRHCSFTGVAAAKRKSMSTIVRR